MADYFTNFSVGLRLPTPEAQTYALTLASEARRIQQGEEMPPAFPVRLHEAVEDWCFETEPDGTDKEPALWLHSENGGIDALCAFIQHLLQKFSPNEIVTFEWSNDCSQPRVNAYGGGAAIVTAGEIKTMSTCQWIQQNMPSIPKPSTKIP